MQVIEFEKDKRLECRFRGHHFDLERSDDAKCFGNWYMRVTDDAGGIACDGWIDDSGHYTVQQAMATACDGAILEPPKRWPKDAI